jgi:hypothetical protein
MAKKMRICDWFGFSAGLGYPLTSDLLVSFGMQFNIERRLTSIDCTSWSRDGR